MRLLICTQAIDRNDSALGFFHRWVEEFAKHTEKITVICLRKGEYDLPNVEVIALGERARLLRAIELLAIVFGRRREYDAVFVHMNPEYVVAAGWLWRLLGKRIALWYTHRSVNSLLKIATFFANDICTASKESFRIPSQKTHILGHGIDTEFFSPDLSIPRQTHLLSVGRLMPSKHHDTLIRAAAAAGRPLRIAGEGPERETLKALARELGADVQFLGGLTQERLRDEYRSAAYFLHASDTGSLDKVVLEAAACDCSVITTTKDLYLEVPVHSVNAMPSAIADAIAHAAREDSGRRRIVKEHHSLRPLIEKIVWILSKNK